MSAVVNKETIIKRLWKFGHFKNPDMPTGVELKDLSKLSLRSTEVKTAIKSYQTYFDAEFQQLAKAYHDRKGEADGEIGLATTKLLEMDRCGRPDFEAAIVSEARSPWPKGCWEEYPDDYAFAIHWDRSGMPSYLQPYIDQCIEKCYAAYRNIGIVMFSSPDRNRCNTRVTFTRGNGWIGLAIVGNAQRCSDRIWAKFDNRYRPRQMVDQWSRLLAHEFGHNWSLRHSRGGIMNPSISSGPFTTTAWRGDPSERILTGFTGGVPVPPKPGPGPGPGPGPDPDPPTGGVMVRGEITIQAPGASAEPYILVKKPRI